MVAYPSRTQRRAWVTLITGPSYLPGVVSLAYSLSVHSTKYPLVVLVTPKANECRKALELESEANNLAILVRPVQDLEPPAGQGNSEEFPQYKDVLTKLRAFELTTYDKCVFLDADISLFKNMDELFDIVLPSEDWIGACHVCVCNLDHEDWCPQSWRAENCPWSMLRHPASMVKPPQSMDSVKPPHPFALLNGGLLLYCPSKQLWNEVLHSFNTSTKLGGYKLPDQEFLADFFAQRWLPLPWKYNAIKTMESWHRNVWRDDAIHGLHWIVDKPWQKRIASDGIAGYLGRDVKTHSWWWSIWEQWRKRRNSELISLLDNQVAPRLDAETDRKQCEENKAKGLPRPLIFPDGTRLFSD
ncbi:MAG: hypothetical protein LQ351_001103 [Letrouitia transgressa]|nr:MAG: hypothetical protein LQ351_001103 [Letrouitia transgressa]